MKLSIIVPVYKKGAILNEFLQKAKDQTSKNFELIIIVDTDKEKTLESIDKFKTLKSNIKVIYNSMRQGRTEAVRTGINEATGDYSIIMSVSNSFNPDFVKNALLIVKEKQTDIIEFKAVFKEPKKFKGKIRKVFSNGVKISEHKEVIAYTYPFDFNKIFKTDVIKKAADGVVNISVNSRFAISLLYKTFLVAETYSTVSKELVISRATVSDNFNPLKIIRQWKDLISFEEKNFEGEYTAELMYARYIHEIVFLFGFVGISKNKILLEKLKKNFDKSKKADFANFAEINKYMLMNNKETLIIKQNNTKSKLTKIFKNF